ncbi:hypothetical protein SAMN05443549_101516 [Flavobacterium fluvii]|uniref:DUF4239 domain-containing protein n=1 Tax=Flavobacterium fluvii TaxID=468056 RepID=A0A1M5EWY6_9FLAO|nr:hypothetical protein [Flavobacterium fluvii]SHF83552.1 hypothetical protein SAMN05443549_101516 [Flavobacterium fluvii]
MVHSFLNDLDAFYIVLLLFFSMLVAVWIGYKIASKNPKASTMGTELLSPLLGLLALLMAFTFGMSNSRYDDRKNNLIDEANCIGTAILRSDIYPDSLKMEFKKDFESYLDSRRDFYTLGNDEAKINASLKKSAEMSDKLWNRASFFAKDKNYFIQSNMMLPALNDMFDSASKSNIVFNSKVPETIVYLLLIFSVIISLYIGYKSGLEKKIERNFILGFCLLICVVIFITLDLDRSRRGLIKIDTEIEIMQKLNQK